MSLPKAAKFDLVEHAEGAEGHWCIKILDGDYAGLIYQYNTVNIEEEADEDGAVLHFSTTTIEKPDDLDLTPEQDKVILGDILVNIIAEQLEHMSENGTPDTEQSAT